MRKFLFAFFFDGRITWTAGLACLACFVVGAWIRGAYPDATALTVLGALTAGVIVGWVVWQFEFRKTPPHSSR